MFNVWHAGSPRQHITLIFLEEGRNRFFLLPINHLPSTTRQPRDSNFELQELLLSRLFAPRQLLVLDASELFAGPQAALDRAIAFLGLTPHSFPPDTFRVKLQVSTFRLLA